MADAADQVEHVRVGALRLLLLSMGGLVVLGAAAVLSRSRSGAAASVGILALLVAFAVQAASSAPGLRHLRERHGLAALALQGCLAVLPAAAFGLTWPGMFGFLAGTLPLVVKGPAGRLLGAGVVGATCAAGVLVGLERREWVLDGAATAAVGLVVYGATRLAELVFRVHALRERLAWGAVAQERRRFARDLHDLLGYSLSAIALKTDLAHRLVREAPDRALAELDSARDVAQQALADVRSVARGLRELTFAVEAESARSLLAAADIRAGVDIRCAVPDAVSTVLATVLREGVTNVLRHSKATQVCIEVRDLGNGFIRFTLANDGVRGGAGKSAPCPGGRGGLGNLAERLAAVGGRLTVDVDERGWHRVVAEAPSAPVAE
ncbi:histidine kinase [Streptomyces sp. NBC_00287]|uniref:sensor histidine kinase n=1 Tax=Streptomyces sp. NBC_00287 TaxID=2975702 RepID=UPI002E281396|nr:histidine kinase [Streptomyces sp. NBC_00287]